MLGTVIQVLATACAILIATAKWLWAGRRITNNSLTNYTQSSLPPTWELFLHIAQVQWKHFRQPASAFSLRLPLTRLHLTDITIDPEHLASYNSLCGFEGDSQSGFVPLTYPLLLLFKLQSLLLLDDDFPFPGLGLVHLSNSIEQRKQVTLSSDASHIYHATVYCEEAVQCHKKGYCFTVVSELYEISTGSDAKELVWCSKSTVLSQCAHKSLAEQAAPCPVTPYVSSLPEAQLSTCAGETTWGFEEHVGRQFAALSSDYNPIHYHRMTAALFGFTRGHIIHGMCTCARALASIQCEDGRAKFFVNNQTKKGKNGIVVFYVEFKTPVFLPGKVILQTVAAGNHEDCVDRRRGGEGVTDDVTETCFLRVMSAKKRDQPHVKGFISYTAPPNHTSE